jgi:rod shape-determining protein MreB
VAVISLEGIVVSRSLRVAGDEIDEAILQYARREHSLAIGERTAEETKIKIGSAYNTGCERTAELRGRDLITGLPKVVEVTSSDIREAIANPVNQIVEEVKICVEETPPELVADIMESGITLAGGGALLEGLDIRLNEETKMPVQVADDPLTCVVRGTGRALEEIDVLRKVFIAAQNGKTAPRR